MSKNSDRPHVVDEENKKVYLTVDSFMAAMGAACWVKQKYPGYECMYVTQHTLTEKRNDRTENHKE